MADRLVSPGEQITPQLDMSCAIELAERLYGVTVTRARQLDGYDDKNYHLQVTTPPNNKYIKELWPHGYVLKIMNSSDSKKVELVGAQCEMMIYLGEHGISSPQPQRSVDGKLFCFASLKSGNNEQLENTEHAVRLLTFVEGTILEDVPWTYPLHYQVGRYTAQVDLVLRGFSHPAYKNYSSLWLLKNCPKIKEYLYVEKDEHRTVLVTEVIKEFEDKVLTKMSSLKSGMIHGDINTFNILLHPSNNTGTDDKWEVSALLDLGDAHWSPYLIELALAMAYMMLQSSSPQSGSEVVGGYCCLHPLPYHELQLLKVCVCARLCQSLVLGLYTHSQNPENIYVLSSQASGWQLLETLWATDTPLLEAVWFSKLPGEYHH